MSRRPYPCLWQEGRVRIQRGRGRDCLVGEEVGEVYKQTPVSLPLIGGQGQDTAHIVVQHAVLLFGEVAHNMTSYK